MLVLTRFENQTIYIDIPPNVVIPPEGAEIMVKVCSIKDCHGNSVHGGKVRIGFKSSREFSILRAEVKERIKHEGE